MNGSIKALLLVGACAALAVSADAANFTGFGEVTAGIGYDAQGYTSTYSDASAASSEFSAWKAVPWIFSGTVRGNTAFDDGINLQIDLGGQIPGYRSFTFPVYGLGFHLNRRSTDYLFGGFVSIGDNNKGHMVTAGLESQVYFDKLTLYGQISYTAGIQGDVHTWGDNSLNLYANARYFLSDRLMLSGGLDGIFGSGTNDAYDEDYGETYAYKSHSSALTWELKCEYLLESLPLSISVGYRGLAELWQNTYDYPSGSRYGYRYFDNGNMLTIGLRYYFGQPSLKANDRTGASLEDHNPWYGANPINAGWD